MPPALWDCDVSKAAPRPMAENTNLANSEQLRTELNLKIPYLEELELEIRELKRGQLHDRKQVHLLPPGPLVYSCHRASLRRLDFLLSPYLTLCAPLCLVRLLACCHLGFTD
jgi:hypothetical protein